MDAFSYLSVLLSIIIGLAITQVLQGYRSLLLNRRRVTLFFPPLAWSGYIILIAVQMWWSSFGLANRPEWSFFAFTIILLQTILFYMMAALVLPDIPPDDTIDLRAHYFRECGPFYGIFAATVAVSIIKNVTLDGGMNPIEWAFHGFFVSVGTLAAFIRRPYLHHIVTAAIGLVFVTYIVILFAHL